MEAAENGKIITVKVLIENYDAYVNQQCQPEYSTVESALSLALSKGHLDVVKYLIEKGAVDHDNNKCLFLAAKKGHIEVMKILLRN